MRCPSIAWTSACGHNLPTQLPRMNSSSSSDPRKAAALAAVKADTSSSLKKLSITTSQGSFESTFAEKLECLLATRVIASCTMPGLMEDESCVCLHNVSSSSNNGHASQETGQSARIAALESHSPSAARSTQREVSESRQVPIDTVLSPAATDSVRNSLLSGGRGGSGGGMVLRERVLLR